MREEALNAVSWTHTQSLPYKEPRLLTKPLYLLAPL